MHSSILNFSSPDKETQMRPCVLSTQTDLLSQKHFLNQFFFLFLFSFGEAGGQVHYGCGADSSESALTANKTQGAVLIWWTRLTAEIVEGTFWKNIK